LFHENGYLLPDFVGQLAGSPAQSQTYSIDWHKIAGGANWEFWD
jgi:hypothetical protein